MKKTTKKGVAPDEADKHMFRYWIEIRDVASGSLYSLPLTAVMVIPLVRKGSKEDRPAEERLRLKDGDTVLEAKSLDELAAQLQERYPDGVYERTLHRQRDVEAEERHAKAMSGLMDILVDAMVREILEEQ